MLMSYLSIVGEYRSPYIIFPVLGTIYDRVGLHRAGAGTLADKTLEVHGTVDIRTRDCCRANGRLILYPLRIAKVLVVLFFYTIAQRANDLHETLEL